MGKLTVYVMILTVMVILLYTFGLTTCAEASTCSPNSVVLDLALNPQNLWESNWYKIVVEAITALGAAAVIIGFFTSNKLEIAIKAPIMVYLFSVGWDIIVLFNHLKSVNVLVATLLTSPLAIVYILTVVEWGFGHD